MYSHHIHATAKIKSIQSLAQEYKVHGIFKIGKPGYIYIDGTIKGVQSSVKALKVFLVLVWMEKTDDRDSGGSI